MKYFVILNYNSIYDRANSCLNKVKHTGSTNGISIALFSQEMHDCNIAKFVA